MSMVFGFQCIDEEGRKVLATPRLRVVFEWRVDRWAHAVEVADDSAWARLAESVEGIGDPRRVVSPVFQQFHWQPKVQGGCGMLIGQSGPHHFSAVFSASWIAQYRIDVDIADRCRSEVEALAGTYRVNATAGELVEAESGRAAWAPRGGERLELKARASGRVAVAEPSPSAMLAQVGALLQPSETTHRLVYCWTWTPRQSAPP